MATQKGNDPTNNSVMICSSYNVVSEANFDYYELKNTWTSSRVLIDTRRFRKVLNMNLKLISPNSGVVDTKFKIEEQIIRHIASFKDWG